MMKARKLLDDGFLIGLVLALFLASKIVPYLLCVGLLPIVLFWNKIPLSSLTASSWRLFLPVVIYFGYSIGLLYLYPGIDPLAERPGNPGIELYAVAITMFVLGFLRSLQINELYTRFNLIAPWALICSFLVLSSYFALGLDGCRVKVAAPWPFIPALIFTTLAFLLFVGWEQKTKVQRYIRLFIVSLSIVVVLAYTASRGVAVGQFGVLASFILLRFARRFRNGLPTIFEIVGAAALGLVICVIVGAASGCANFDRWQAFTGFSSTNQTRETGAVISKQDDPIVNSPMLPDQPAPGEAATGEPVEGSSHARFAGDDSISVRLDMWMVSVDAIRQAPFFGHGALSLKTIIQDKFGYEHNHNQYLAWLVTGGVVSLAIGFLFLSTPAIISKGLVPVDRIIMTLALTGLWGAAMMFDAFLSLKFYLHFFCLLLGFLYALIRSANTTDTYGKPQ